MLKLEVSSLMTIERIGCDIELHCGDAYQILPMLGRFHALVTDPPYKFNTSGGGRYRAARGAMDRIAADGLDQGFDHTIINPLQFDAAVVFCHNDQLPVILPHMAGSYSRFALLNWRKSNPQPVANRHYRPDTEFYIHAWSRHCPPQGTLDQKARWWDGGAPRGADRYGHDTPKPLDLMRKIITNVGGDSLIDPFMGTGTTIVAALQAGFRRIVGIEHNPAHYAAARRRISAALARIKAAA